MCKKYNYCKKAYPNVGTLAGARQVGRKTRHFLRAQLLDGLPWRLAAGNLGKFVKLRHDPQKRDLDVKYVLFHSPGDVT